MDFGFTTVAAITIICYLLAQTIKLTRLDAKWLPCICGAVGGLCGVAGLYLVPGFPAQDVLSAIAVGIVSGLAATGVHQAVKQLNE